LAEQKFEIVQFPQDVQTDHHRDQKKRTSEERHVKTEIHTVHGGAGLPIDAADFGDHIVKVLGDVRPGELVLELLNFGFKMGEVHVSLTRLAERIQMRIKKTRNMCESVFANFANAINGVSDLTQDLVPSPLLFSGTQCGGVFYPNSGGSFLSNPFQTGDTITGTNWGSLIPGQILSFFIPFNVQSVTLQSVAGRTSTFLGPFSLSDVSSIVWQKNGANPADENMFNDPIQSFAFNQIANWLTESVYNMCNGRTSFVSGFPLTRYAPQSDRCDAFMTNEWCPAHPTNIECGCFSDLVVIQQKSKELGVNLPVLCYGESCALKPTYKTSAMLTQQCSVTICQQTINSTPGIINAGNDTIFCAGQFFNEHGSIPLPPNVVPAPAADVAGPKSTPFYVWIMVGMSAILFILLIFLLFGSRPKKVSKNILTQLQELQNQPPVTSME